MLVPFVQLEFPGLIGLPDGRYLAREGERELVLIVQVLGAPRPRRRGRRRPRPVEPSATDELPLTRATVAGAERFDHHKAALAWLKATVGDPERRAAEVRSATMVLNRALAVIRAEARDPLVQDVGATRALSVRIGFGDGDQLAEGRWSEARELPPPPRGRLDDVDAQTRVAAVLAGRDRVLPTETLLQRARLDLQQDRLPEAGYELRAAAEALSEVDDPRSEKLREQLAEAERNLERKLGS